MSEPLPWSDRLRMVLLRIDRPAVVGLAVLAGVAVVVAVLLAWNARTRPVVYTGDGSRLVGSAAASAAPGVVPGAAPEHTASVGAGDRVVVVDVVGRVRRPGLVTVPAGARVADVVRAAGGFRRPSDARSVNQARLVTDGEQVVVGEAAPAAGPAGAGGAAGAVGQTGAPVDLNTATAEQLDTLPGVGPVLAQRILEHRSTNGGFRSVDELRDVSGIGEKTFADIAPHVRV